MVRTSAPPPEDESENWYIEVHCSYADKSPRLRTDSVLHEAKNFRGIILVAFAVQGTLRVERVGHDAAANAEGFLYSRTE